MMRTLQENRRNSQAWVARVRLAMPSTGTRTRLRDADEARLLRERGTPSSLIGPVRTSNP